MSANMPKSRGLMHAFTATAQYPHIPKIYTFDAESVLTFLIHKQLAKADSFIIKSAAWLSDWFVWQNFHSPWKTEKKPGVYGINAMQIPELCRMIYQDSIENRKAGKLQEYIIWKNCPALMDFPFNPEAITDREAPRATLPKYDDLLTKQFFVPWKFRMHVATKPNPLWVEALTSLELSLRRNQSPV